MEQKASRYPARIVVVGCVLLLSAVLDIYAGVSGRRARNWVKRQEQIAALGPANTPFVLRVECALNEHGYLCRPVQTALGFVTLVVAVQFLRLRPWAWLAVLALMLGGMLHMVWTEIVRLYDLLYIAPMYLGKDSAVLGVETMLDLDIPVCVGFFGLMFFLLCSRKLRLAFAPDKRQVT